MRGGKCEITKETDIELTERARRLGVFGKRFAFFVGSDAVRQITLLEDIELTTASPKALKAF